MQVDKEKPVDTAKDIVDQGRKLYYFAEVDESAMHEALPDDTFKYEKANAKESYANGYKFSLCRSGYFPQHILDLMLHEGIVTLSPGSHLDRLYSIREQKIYGYAPFRLSKYPNRIHPSKSGFIINKNSALKTIFQPVIMRLIEADIIEHYSRSSYNYWTPGKEEIPKAPLNIQHMMIGYAIYIIGLSISILTFYVESKNKNSNNWRTN